MTTGLDRTYHAMMLIVLFLVSHFNSLFVPCGRLSWLPVTFYCTLNTHYRIKYTDLKI